MPRRSIRRPDLEPYQRKLALMIDDALKRGQRGDGEDQKRWKPWTNRPFADRACVAENSVSNWRDPDRRMPPKDIDPVLKVFYGVTDRFKEDKAKMKLLWQLARGYVVDDDIRARNWEVGRSQNLQGIANLVTLRTHAPVPWNDGTMRLAITLVITPDRDLSYRGKAITVGMTEALLCLESSAFQPAWKSLPSQRGLANFVLTTAGERIVGPLDPTTGMIDGEPLGDEYLMVLETVATDVASATVAVHAPRGSFRVLPQAGSGTVEKSRDRCSANQEAVVNALFHEQLRDRDDHDRAVLSRAPIGPRAA
jgi:hypothetical protein